MKLSASVHEVKKSGERLCVVLRAQSLPTESIYSNVLHEIEVPDSATARKTYYVGRLIELKVTPQ